MHSGNVQKSSPHPHSPYIWRQSSQFYVHIFLDLFPVKTFVQISSLLYHATCHGEIITSVNNRVIILPGNINRVVFLSFRIRAML